MPPGAGKLNILMLFDEGSTHVGTVAEHLHAFRVYSDHNIHFLPATRRLPLNLPAPDLTAFDAILIHYSVRLSVEAHLSAPIAEAVAAYDGPKMLFIQDEYDCVETARRWIERLGISTIFTTVPPDEIDRVYPRARFPAVRFIPTLTGYVPEAAGLDGFAMPMRDRSLRIAYRGRELPHQYGMLGQEKRVIGVEMRRLAESRGIPVDIEVEEGKRIYGDGWYRFIGSARATLGTESGANVMDEHGHLAQLARQHADLPFQDFFERFLAPHEGQVHINGISPKVFEAIRLRTALVLFEGGYSGVVRPHEHYIPLAKDFSNAEAVFAQLEDVPFLEAMTERAYRDVIATGDYSYRRFVDGVDQHVREAAGPKARADHVSVPDLAAPAPGRVGRLLRQGWHALPAPLRGDLLAFCRDAVSDAQPASSKKAALARRLWQAMPGVVRNRLLSRL